MIRHFTVTGFVVQGDRTLLHWHRKEQMWLPPGGHVEPDEDPVQAVLREVREETGLDAEIVATGTPYRFQQPQPLASPAAMLVADVKEGPHQHIDMIYFLRARNGGRPQAQAEDAFAWVDEQTLRRREPVDLTSCGVVAPVADDVCELGLAAIDAVRRANGGHA